LLLVVDFSSIEHAVVNRLLYGFGNEYNKTIIHESRTYSGLGNQIISLVGSIALSLASGRRLRSENTYLFYNE